MSLPVQFLLLSSARSCSFLSFTPSWFAGVCHVLFFCYLHNCCFR